jgi:hypothetical protein
MGTNGWPQFRVLQQRDTWVGSQWVEANNGRLRLCAM